MMGQARIKKKILRDYGCTNLGRCPSTCPWRHAWSPRTALSITADASWAQGQAVSAAHGRSLLRSNPFSSPLPSSQWPLDRRHRPGPCPFPLGPYIPLVARIVIFTPSLILINTVHRRTPLASEFLAQFPGLLAYLERFSGCPYNGDSRQHMLPRLVCFLLCLVMD
jgi:hypothetical protein